MKLILMTDLEGCAGVLNSVDWCMAEGVYHEEAKTLLTAEANAAIQGFMENGFSEILVLDGHGPGGIRLLDLDERVSYQRGFVGPYPVGLMEGYDALAFVGQHAKAGTPYAHLPHSSTFRLVDQTINGISVGEFGQVAFMGATMGISPIFGSGDKAFCQEAAALCPDIHTVCVKEGLSPGTGAECIAREYQERNTAAIHLHPNRARQRIYEGACEAARAFGCNPERFSICAPSAPYEIALTFRTSVAGQYEVKKYHHSASLIAAWNLTWRDV